MAWFFADSFDLYSAPADMYAGKWDSGFNFSAFVAGRFGGQTARLSATPSATKSSGANDPVHHVNCAHRKTSALSGTTAVSYISFLDGATAQCSIVSRSDGAILLTSGGPTGTTLATYAAAVTAQNVWFTFEFEVVIHPTAGSFTVRTQGAASNSFQATGLNTRGGTANSYANKLTLGNQNTPSGSEDFDDFIWRSDPTAVAWLGDQRCYTLYPSSDASLQFAAAPSPTQQLLSGTTGSVAQGANAALLNPFIPAVTGTIGSALISVVTGGVGHFKAAIYNAVTGAVLGTSNEITNPTSGILTLTFASPPTVVKGQSYYLATDQDFSMTYDGGTVNGFSSTITYSGFPTTNPALTANAARTHAWINITPSNFGSVNEAQQDGPTTYVYDSTVGHADFYNLDDLPTLLVPPSSITAVVSRAFVGKSDAGSRSAQVQLKSGATTVQSTALVLSASFQWTERIDLVDPNTSAAWTIAAVNAAQIGPRVSA